MADRPTGAVTFLFTDVEGSTQAWENNPTGMAAAMEVHDRVLRSMIEAHGGFVFATGGDSFSAAFSSPTTALTAAVEAQQALVESECGLRVRMGVHSGEAVERDGNYFGPPLNRTARLMSIGHGGQILVSDITRGLVPTAEFSFADLGEHRLADLAAPVRVAQLVADGLEASFPALKSAVTTDNLPRLGEVFGRASDIENLTRLLADQRLVTLTGAGGIGKTTLATTVAHAMSDPFPDGRWLIDLTDLAPGSDHSAVAGAVAGVDDRFGSVEALAPRRMLMILDNCEHVLAAASEYLSDLLAAAPEVSVLATSREPLGLRGEKVMPVAPLSVEEDSEHASAVDLFVERAEEAGAALNLESDRDAITSICREVGGLPLAIELAAARTAVMTPGQILHRLTDRLSVLRGGRSGPEHHRTIEATIAWSYDLLDENTQQLLRFLSVFEGGFDLDAAEAVGGTDAVDRLTDLVRKSLVHRHDDRFSMLEAVRQYATARLIDAGDEDEARRRHFEFFANWAHDVYHRDERIKLSTVERRWISDNLVNLRTAVAYGAQRGEAVRAAEAAVVQWPYTIEVLHGRIGHEDWFEPLLDHLDRLDPQLQMAVLHGSGTLSMADDLDRAHRLLQAEYDLHRETGLVARSITSPLNNLALVALMRGRWDEADHLYREGIEEHKRTNRPHHVLSGNLAELIYSVDGDRHEALDIIREAEALDHLALPWQASTLRINEAKMLIEIGDHNQARTLLTETLTYLRQSEVKIDQQALALVLLSRIAHETGDTSLSSTLLLEAIETKAVEGLPQIWHEPESLHLARILIDHSAAQTARRVLNEYLASGTIAFLRRESASPIAPVFLRRLRELETRLEHDGTEASPDDDLPLIDAIRQALASHQTT